MDLSSFALPVAGFLVGTLVGLTGVGGGSLMTPVLILVFGMHPLRAVGTDLLFAAVTKMVGTAVHGRLRTVDWRVAAWLALGSLPTTAVVLTGFAVFGPPAEAANRWVGLALGVAMIVTAASVAFRPQIVRWSGRVLGDAAVSRAAPLTVAAGVVLGIIVPLTSVGGGAIGMPVLLLLWPGLPTAYLVGADIAHAVPLTLVAGAGHLLLEPVNWTLLGSLLLGSVPGVAIGSLLSGRVPERLLRWCLATALVVAGWQLLK